MTKAAIRAMDTVEAYLKEKTDTRNLTSNIDTWVVAGASKRGWTSWLTAAMVPDRVGVIVPLVLDMLNMIPNMHKMWKAYGGWSWAFKEYYKLNFTSNIDTPEALELMRLVDPYYYKERLTMPKLVIDSADDEFFMPEDTHYWWDEMPDPKKFLLMPNNDHSTATGLLEEIPAAGAYIKLA